MRRNRNSFTRFLKQERSWILKKINIKTDTTILLASEAQIRGYQIYYFEPENLSFLNGKVIALCKHIKIHSDKKKFYSIKKTINFNLEKSKVILIRNDPPFDNRYLYTTFLLNHISKKVLSWCVFVIIIITTINCTMSSFIFPTR